MYFITSSNFKGSCLVMIGHRMKPVFYTTTPWYGYCLRSGDRIRLSAQIDLAIMHNDQGIKKMHAIFRSWTKAVTKTEVEKLYHVVIL